MPKVVRKIDWEKAQLIPIKELEYNSRTGTVMLYEVKYQCCKRRVHMTRKNILCRMDKGAKICLSCASIINIELGRQSYKKNRRERMEDYGVTPPAWPVPRRDLIGAHVPFYDRASSL